MTMLPWLQEPWARFQERLSSDRLAHAMLLHGPEGTGKLQLASAMAARLLCIGSGEFACGSCRSCQLYATGAHPDWFLLKPEQGKHQILIDLVRDTIGSLSLTPSFSKRNVALIYPAELMNSNSANALLKSLEEPPGETVLLLVAHDPSRLPATIRSRCQSIAVLLPEPPVAEHWLVTNHGMDAAQARIALSAAAGSPLDAVALQKSGEVSLYQSLLASLSALALSPNDLTSLSSQLAAIEPRMLWAWLSMCCADALRASLGGNRRAWLVNTASLDSRNLSDLQLLADRNRMLSRTPVRQDLLLMDWLIKWSRLSNR